MTQKEKDELCPMIDTPASVQRADKAAWKDLIEMNKELRERVIQMTDELEGDGLGGPDAVKALGLRQVCELNSEHIVLLKGDITQLREELVRARGALALMRRATLQGHGAHWDETGGSGTGCPACLRIQELRQQADAALQPEGRMK